MSDRARAARLDSMDSKTPVSDALVDVISDIKSKDDADARHRSRLACLLWEEALEFELARFVAFSDDDCAHEHGKRNGRCVDCGKRR